jgi:eukaryotic-like serine/threonine-protein kinase
MLACVFGFTGAAVLYYAVFEGLWGAAAGKALCGLRVVGPDRNPPGFARACVRALIYVLPPFVPYWVAFATNPKAYFTTSQWTQMLVGCSCYVVIALLFVTARRRNGFAAVQDLLTRTRVISRAAISARPVLPISELPLPAVESAITIGPYHVLQALTDGRARRSVRAVNGENPPGVEGSHSGGGAYGVTRPTSGEEWFLAYDLKLLRKVWLRVVPPSTRPVVAPLRSLGRIGRLRWLTGKRTPEENWDAFEAPTGRPFLELITSPQPWREVRYWLHDLAMEISAAEKDGTLPELALDRIWITAEGRAKLLDFPAPGSAGKSEIRNPKSESNPYSRTQTAQGFLAEVATAALAGTGAASGTAAGDVAAPLPLHARAFLRSLSQMAGADTVIAALKPLLNRVAAVSRLRRAALVGGCVVFPLLACACGMFGLTFLQEITRRNPGLMDLSSALQMRTSARFWGGKKAQLPTDSQYAIYIAHHYAGLITNAATWSSPYVLTMVKGDARKFAEQSVAEHPAPTAAEIAEADAAVDKFIPKQQFFAEKVSASLPVMVLAASLLFYVGLPALVAALLFRGGVVLLIAGVTYVRKDGLRASRLRLLWRSLVAWSPAVPMFGLAIAGLTKHWVWQPWLALALLGLLAAVSVGLRERGLQDRLAGTWPVPR